MFKRFPCTARLAIAKNFGLWNYRRDEGSSGDTGLTDTFSRAFLQPKDEAPFVVLNPNASSGLIICCDHAGRKLPASLLDHGLPPAAMERHIASDIGAHDIARRLSERLDAVAICGTYSRLVIDLNRYPWDPAALVPVSDGTHIPFNQNVSSSERQARVDAIHRPYHNAIATAIDRVTATDRKAVLISVHTMTDQLTGGAWRPEAYAVLHAAHDPWLARAMLDWLPRHVSGVVGDNTPYSLDEGIDFTVPEHGFRRGIPTFMFEVRQDLVATRDDARTHADVLADGLQACMP